MKKTSPKFTPRTSMKKDTSTAEVSECFRKVVVETLFPQIPSRKRVDDTSFVKTAATKFFLKISIWHDIEVRLFTDGVFVGL